MSVGPTRGAIEIEQPTWHSRPVAAKAIRVVAFLVPLLAAWGAVRATKSHFIEVDGTAGVVLWLAQSLMVGFVGSLIVDRFTRRLLPLASLLTLSLVFPDEAPSRFGLALRAGTVRQLKRRIVDVGDNGLGNDEQTAAVAAVELVTALGRHDRLTRGHTERVRAYADVIGEELELPPHDRAMLSWGALLHDVGKMTVPEEILNKDGRPTDQEWQTLQNHPAAAEQILAPLAAWLGPWIGAATQHHERWDGTGYPQGLAGREISLAGRITAVADAYDVITSKRSYKKPMTPAAARKELVRCAKTQFDPDVVRAFVNVSLGRRWLPGPLASLLELPAAGSAVHIVARAPALVAGTAAVISSVLVTAETLPWTEDPFPDNVAMVTDEDEPTEITLPTPPPTTASVVASTGSATTIQAPSSEAVSTTDPRPSTTTTSTSASSAGPSSTATSSSPPSQQPTTSKTATTSSPEEATTTTTIITTTTSTTTATTSTSTTTTSVAAPGASWAVEDTADNASGAMTVIDALDNDQLPPDIDYSTLRIVRQPNNGTATINSPPGNPANAKLRYRSNSGYEGVDSFDYEICDTSGTCSTATVTITISP